MDPEEFHAYEYELVRLYRSDEQAQEAIAIALTRANLSPSTPLLRSRLGEIFAMLQHVYDPMISGVREDDDVLACA